MLKHNSSIKNRRQTLGTLAIRFSLRGVLLLLILVSGKPATAQAQATEKTLSAKERLLANIRYIPKEAIPVWKKVVQLAEEKKRMPTLFEFGEILTDPKVETTQYGFGRISKAFALAQRPSLSRAEFMEMYADRCNTLEKCSVKYLVTAHEGNPQKRWTYEVSEGYSSNNNAFSIINNTGGDGSLLLTIDATNGKKHMTYFREGVNRNQPITKPTATLRAEIYPTEDYSSFILNIGPVMMQYPDIILGKYRYIHPYFKPQKRLVDYAIYETNVEIEGRKYVVIGSLMDYMLYDEKTLLLHERVHFGYKHRKKHLEKDPTPSFRLVAKKYSPSKTVPLLSKYQLSTTQKFYDVEVFSYDLEPKIPDSIHTDLIPENACVTDSVEHTQYINNGTPIADQIKKRKKIAPLYTLPETSKEERLLLRLLQ